MEKNILYIHIKNIYKTKLKWKIKFFEQKIEKKNKSFRKLLMNIKWIKLKLYLVIRDYCPFNCLSCTSPFFIKKKKFRTEAELQCTKNLKKHKIRKCWKPKILSDYIIFMLVSSVLLIFVSFFNLLFSLTFGDSAFFTVKCLNSFQYLINLFCLFYDKTFFFFSFK